jgi:hypothetical protein
MVTFEIPVAFNWLCLDFGISGSESLLVSPSLTQSFSEVEGFIDFEAASFSNLVRLVNDFLGLPSPPSDRLQRFITAGKDITDSQAATRKTTQFQ